MAHLISPIDIDGTHYCIKHGATTPKWRTVSIFDSPTSLVGAEDDDAWEVDASGLKFATCCVWQVTFKFDATGVVAGPGVFYSITINGTTVISEVPGTVGTYYHTVDLNSLGLMGRACGNLWEILCIYVGTVEVTEVVFGPPV